MSTRRSFLKHAAWAGALLITGLPSRATAVTFPRLAARNLLKQNVKLPAGFSASRNVVFVVFSRKQQEDVDSWAEPLKAVGEAGNLESWQTTLMGDIGRALRAIVEGAMRGIVRTDEARARYLLLYGERTELLAHFGHPREDQILVLLLDGSGDELWRGRGPWSSASEAALRAAL